MVKKIITCKRCEREREHSAKGMCASCYGTVRRQTNPETRRKHAERNRRYRKELGEIYLQRERERGKRRRPKTRIYNKAYWQTNKKKLTEYNKKYAKENPQIMVAADHNRIAKKLNAGYLSSKDWLQILEDHSYSCYYCGRDDVPMEQEHKTPYSRGGLHNKENVVPSCRACNATKFTKTEEEFEVFKAPSR